jgi:hypothetical protein
MTLYRFIICRFTSTIPVLNQNSVLDAKDVGCNPIHRLAKARKPSVDDYKMSISRSWFTLERWWDALNEVEKTFSTRGDVSIMLNVVGRPIVFSRYIVMLIELCIESFKDKFFVFLQSLCSL